MESSSGAGEESREIINKAFKATRERFGIQIKNSWLKKYYQLADRLAFVNFMLENGLQCSLLNIYFINGWPDYPEKNVTDKAAWRTKIDDEYAYLGLTDEAKKYIEEVFIDCSVNVEARPHPGGLN
jgi:hypothetical protein